MERRIKVHTAQMHERRRLPKGSPQEEMEAARRELEIVSMAAPIHAFIFTWNRNAGILFGSIVNKMYLITSIGGGFSWINSRIKDMKKLP